MTSIKVARALAAVEETAAQPESPRPIEPSPFAPGSILGGIKPASAAPKAIDPLDPALMGR